MIGADGGQFLPDRSPELDAIQRDPLSFLNSTNNIIITQALARRAHRKLHQFIELTTPAGAQRFEVWGLRDDSVASSFGGMLALMIHWPRGSQGMAFELSAQRTAFRMALSPLALGCASATPQTDGPQLGQAAGRKCSTASQAAPAMARSRAATIHRCVLRLRAR